MAEASGPRGIVFISMGYGYSYGYKNCSPYGRAKRQQMDPWLWPWNPGCNHVSIVEIVALLAPQGCQLGENYETSVLLGGVV